MKIKLAMFLLTLGYWATLIGAVAMYGWKAGALVVLACCYTAGAECVMEMLEEET